MKIRERENEDERKRESKNKWEDGKGIKGIERRK